MTNILKHVSGAPFEDTEEAGIIRSLREYIQKLEAELRIAKGTVTEAQKAANVDLDRRREAEWALEAYRARYAAVEEALQHARSKHPSANYRMFALIEEIGEVGKAWYEYGQHDPRTHAEVCQAIATLIRIIEEDDPTGPSGLERNRVD